METRLSRSKFEPQIRHALSSRPDATAIDFDGVPFTWRQANAIATRVEKLLDGLGLPPFGRVGLVGRNRPAHFSTLWGIFAAARCTAMIHAFQPPRTLAEDIGANSFPIVFAERQDWSHEAIIAADGVGSVGFAFTDDPAAPFERVTAADRPAAGLLHTQHGNTVIELLSSGTTGKPKRIPLSRESIDDLIERTRFQFLSGGAGENAAQLMPWPLASLGGTNAALPAVSFGQLLAIQERFEPAGFLEQMRRYRPTFLSMPPAAAAMMLQLKPAKEDLASVELYFNGSAPIDPKVRQTLEEDYGLPVANAYGATEFAGIVSSWVPEDFAFLKAKTGSCGRALPGLQLRIISPEDGRVMRAGEVGLIEALVPRVGKEWVRTNDLAYLDDDGFLFLEGRADDAIIRGGFKILPEEVAEVLRRHPLVGDAAVIGIEDQRLGMVPAAVIEPRLNGATPTAEDLDAFARNLLPGYKVPVQYAVVDELPRTASLKPRREGLRDLFT